MTNLSYTPVAYDFGPTLTNDVICQQCKLACEPLIEDLKGRCFCSDQCHDQWREDRA